MILLTANTQILIVDGGGAAGLALEERAVHPGNPLWPIPFYLRHLWIDPLAACLPAIHVRRSGRKGQGNGELSFSQPCEPI
jgi:hypothetical protein